ncbi:MAG: ABC transporter ATP-binding protein [Acidobacteria bacterium]|nr:ABC transporter ATP-binding protein [Acidobacteriota bacterium]
MPDAPLLAVRGLRTVFPVRPGVDAAAVDDVSFDVRRGEVLGLVGESGSGKSVTALSIVRLVPPPGRVASGHVWLDGRDLVQIDERDMQRIRGRRIGFVFQEPMVALDPVYTVGRQIEETLAVHGLARGASARRRAVELLAAARVPDPARRAGEYPHQLSGGLRQRAMIALALAAEPALLIADEPTTALDATVQAEILDLLRQLRAELGLSVLLITHDLGVIAEMAERVAVMYAGRLVEEAPVASLLRSPKHPYTRALLSSVPGVTDGPRLHAIAGSVPALGQVPPGCPFAPRCPRRIAACDALPDLLDLGGTGHLVRCILASG